MMVMQMMNVMIALAMDQVVAVMAIIIVIGLLADRILFSPWERFFHRRWGTGSVN